MAAVATEAIVPGVRMDEFGPVLEPETCVVCGAVVLRDWFCALDRGVQWQVHYRTCTEGCRYNRSLLYSTSRRVER